MNIHKSVCLSFFGFFLIGGSHQTKYFDRLLEFVFFIFLFVEISHLFSFVIFLIVSIICTMGKEIGRFYKNNRSKLSTPTLKKPVLSSSAHHT